MSIAEEIIEDKKGGINQCLWFLNLLKIFASSNCAVKNAIPEPITIRKEIKSNWLNEKYNETAIPHIKPIWITFFVKLIPCILFAKSVTKKAIKIADVQELGDAMVDQLVELFINSPLKKRTLN